MPLTVFILLNAPTLNTVGRFFYVLILLLFIVLLAWFSIKLMARARSGRFGGGKKNLEIVESANTGVGAYIQIIRAGDKHIVIGVTREHVTMLTEIDGGSLKFNEPRMLLKAGSFENVFKRLMKGKIEDDVPDDEAEDEEL